MRRLRRTKIVATLGPASSDRTVIASLFRAGADVFRINMSHTSHDRMRELVAAIRSIETNTAGRSAFWSTCRDRSSASAASPAGRRRWSRARPSRSTPIRRPAMPRACTCRIRRSSPRSSPATRCCSTTARSGCAPPRCTTGRIVTRVEVGGKLSDRKGVSLPDTMVPFSALRRQGPLRPRSRARRRRRLGRRCRSSSGRTTSPRRRRSPAAAPP